jgi:crotonobetainyl-CoA:carnitine CoA-transferase CaiB-like acyl-CoA transferase
LMGPLDGIRVLDLSRLLPGGYATLLLADLGADVVKVEEPGAGDYIRWTPPMVEEQSAAHIALNRNKRSIALNLKAERGRELFARLAERADVVVESFRPGVMDRLGAGWEVLRDRNPRLVYCAITGYGQDGPRAATAGHDQNYIGYAGVLGITGEEGRRPTIPGVQVGDLGGGGMAAVISVLTALLKRERTGTGDFCDVSMTDGVVSWLSIHAAQFQATGTVPTRERLPLSGLFPCYRVYPASDGYLTVAALEPQFWSELCAALAKPELAGDAYATGARRKEVIAELEALFATRTREEWMAHFDGLDVCVGPVNDFEETFSDPQIRHRNMLVDASLPHGGKWTHVGNPIKHSSGTGELLRRAAPALGEHTEEVLAEIGVERETIRELRAAGVVG